MPDDDLLSHGGESAPLFAALPRGRSNAPSRRGAGPRSGPSGNKWAEPCVIKNPTSGLSGFFEYMPDDDLLSHGEAPHYHRRGAVSLLSSAWGQVVPTRYGRQAKTVGIMPVIVSSYPGRAQCANPLGLYGQASRAISIG